MKLTKFYIATIISCLVLCVQQGYANISIQNWEKFFLNHMKVFFPVYIIANFVILSINTGGASISLTIL